MPDIDKEPTHDSPSVALSGIGSGMDMGMGFYYWCQHKQNSPILVTRHNIMGNYLYNEDCSVGLKKLSSSSVDLIVTDPPYGISFMGKDWDKALPDIEVWREGLRVLKAGSFAFVMSIPRADCLSRMIISLEDAGFRVNFTPIFWTYASGFPKAQNIGKAVDKRVGAEREVVGYDKQGKKSEGVMAGHHGWAEGEVPVTKGNSPLEGSYGGFQPKPAVEVIIVAMKPLSEKTFVDQALKNQKGITWLDNGRIPTGENLSGGAYQDRKGTVGTIHCERNVLPKDNFVQSQGRFPANLLVSDDVLNDGVSHSGGAFPEERGETAFFGLNRAHSHRVGKMGDSGSFSRYFDLDKWWVKTFPFLIVPKASKSEKNKGLDFVPTIIKGRDEGQDIRNVPQKARATPRINQHPAVKPLKLMSYLIILGSRGGDVVLDPFMGSGTTGIACDVLGRDFMGYETDKQYFDIAKQRLGVR